MRYESLSVARTTGQHSLVFLWSHSLYLLGAVLACLSLVLAIQYGSGYYNYVSLTFLTISVVFSILLIPTLFLSQTTPAGTGENAFISANSVILFVAGLILLEVWLGIQDDYLHYNQIPLFPPFSKGVNWIVFLLVATYLFELLPFFIHRSLSRLTRHRFWLIILLSVMLKVVAVFSSYINKIDVGIMMQESSANLLAGLNPYTTETAGYGGFNYPPLHLLLPLPFYLIFGDTRFGTIIWELIGIGFLYYLVIKEFSPLPKLVILAELILLIFVLQPRSLFIIEQAWGEPLIVGLAAATFYFFYYRPGGPNADILFGAMLAIKQYLVYMCFPLFILYDFNWKRYAISALAFLLIVVPFIVWNPLEFVNRNVFHFFRLPIQTNALGLTAFFYEYGVVVPRWISPVSAGLVSLGLGALLKRFGILGYLHTVILTYLCLFIFGQQAFANYYYLISFFQVMAIIFFVVYHYAPNPPEPVSSPNLVLGLTRSQSSS